MRKYPEVCSKCGMDMEPIFRDAMISPGNPDEPAYWECANFACPNFGKKRKVSE